MDLSWLSWLGPLAAGALLTGGTGFLTDAVKSRRVRRTELEDESRKASRDAAREALTLVRRIKDDLHVGASHDHPDFHGHVDFTTLGALRDVSLLIADAELRRVLESGCDIIGAAHVCADEHGWDSTPLQYRWRALESMKAALATHLRNEVQEKSSWLIPAAAATKVEQARRWAEDRQ